MGHLIFLLASLLAGSSSQELPDLPDYFIGSFEYNIVAEEVGLMQFSLSRDYFDASVGLARSDFAAELLNPEDSGTVVAIINPEQKVRYLIYPEYKNCTVETLYIPPGGGGIIVNPDGTYGFDDLDQVFYVINASDYEYVGNSSANGIELDNWSYTGDAELAGASYHNATFELSIARAGTPTIHGANENPVPWRLYINGEVRSADNNASVSTVIRFFDLTFMRPNYDIFDVSLCFEQNDYVVVVMSVPKGPNNTVDYSTFTDNVRKSIVDYTGLAPIQVGNIQLTSIGGNEIFTTLQLSNITSIAATVDTQVTAMAAYEKITSNIMNGNFPFQIDVGYGNMVAPKEVEVTVASGSATTPTPTEPIPDPSLMPSPTTVTVTVTPSACPSIPAASTANLCPSPAPSSTGKTYSRSYVAGLAFGMIILGAFVATLVIFLVLLLVARHRRRLSLRTGYERQVNS